MNTRELPGVALMSISTLDMKITHGKFPTSLKKFEYGKLPTGNLPTPECLQKISYIYFRYGKFPTRKFPTFVAVLYIARTQEGGG